MPISERCLARTRSGSGTGCPLPPGLAADAPAVEADLTGIDRLEEREAAQERALPRSGRPEDGLHVALMDAERDAPKDLDSPVSAADPDGLEDVLGVGGLGGVHGFMEDLGIEEVAVRRTCRATGLAATCRAHRITPERSRAMAPAGARDVQT